MRLHTTRRSPRRMRLSLTNVSSQLVTRERMGPGLSRSTWMIRLYLLTGHVDRTALMWGTNSTSVRPAGDRRARRPGIFSLVLSPQAGRDRGTGDAILDIRGGAEPRVSVDAS